MRQGKITRAVHAHLKARRRAGLSSRPSTPDIADALSLPRRAVDRALLLLGERAVKTRPR